MAHWNVTIPESFDYKERLTEELELIKFQKSRLEKRVRHLEDELQNIFESVKEHKFVELTYGDDCLRLVEDKEVV